MALSAGTKLGPYEIIAPLGAGGMGEVYRARDTRLDRTVAVKVIPSHLSSDPVRRQRFEREARAISALQHPNICTLYDVGQQEGMDYLVMEYLEGVTLAARLGRGALPLPDVLRYGTEIADALDTAHRRGIVHRDLKPGNIFVTAHGECKVLDFGLAMLEEEAPSAEAPTVTRPEVLTSPGIAMGTVAYMSPEQARGEALDARTDIFSLGAVLYEMSTGKLAFAGKTSALVFKAILDEAPLPITQQNARLPERLQEVIGKALEKDRDLRYQSAADLRTDLKRLARDSESAKYAAVRPKTAPSKTQRWSKAKWTAGIAAAALAIAVSIGGVLYHRSRSAPTLTDKDTIVLADFTNSTGDPVFDDTLKQGLAVQLEQSPFLQLISDRRVNETLKLMGHAPGDRLTPELGREVCLRTGSRAILTGSIAGLGSQYVLGLKAVNCENGDTLAEAQEQATGKEQVLKALDASAINLRSKLGESLSSVQKYATPLVEATTTSLEALQAYSLGMKIWRVQGAAAALPFAKRAVELDPNFAAAYASISACYDNLGETQRAIEYSRKAYELRQRTSELERFTIETNYYEVATGEIEKAVQVIEQWRQTYPRDARAARELGFMYSYLGDHERALEQARNALRMGPHSEVYYFALANAYVNLNRFDEAEAVFREADERGVRGAFLLGVHYQVAFLKDDVPRMEQLRTSAVDTAEQFLQAQQADTEGWYGRLKNARELTKRAMDSAQRGDTREAAATYQAAAALREVESGYPEKARADVAEAMKLGPGRDVLILGALALARAGDAAGAERFATELDRCYPLDTLVQRYWLPSIRAAVALQRKDANQALKLLQPVSLIQLSQPTTAPQVALCPVYLRGEAYLMLRDGQRAAAEFQKFVDHRGLVGNFQWGALARLGLARSYAMSGDIVKAKAAYQDFLNLWKDADPDIPILGEAKADYAKLP